jgi:hypothetical protein
VSQGLVEHRPAGPGTHCAEVHLVDERLGDRVGVVVRLGEGLHERVAGLGVEAEEPLPHPARTLDGRVVDLVLVAELAGDLARLGPGECSRLFHASSVK